MEKILYVHGFNSTPYSNTYNTFKKLLNPDFYELHTIDYDPKDPKTAVDEIKKYVKENEIDTIIGSSLGGFLTLHIFGVSRIVINPCWNPADELPLIGYDGPTDVYKTMLADLRQALDDEEAGLVSGCFAHEDELLGKKYVNIFQKYFLRLYAIPGGHRVSNEAAELIVNDILPKHEYETNDFVRKYLDADMLPMWLD